MARLRCLFGRHDPLLTQRATGDRVVLVWVCRHCLRELGVTDLLEVVDPRPLVRARLQAIVRHANRRPD